jgi:hypothetical protein
MTDLFKLILGILASRFKSRATLEAENLILRQQVNVLRRRTPKRPHFNNTSRFLFVWLYRWQKKTHARGAGCCSASWVCCFSAKAFGPLV